MGFIGQSRSFDPPSRMLMINQFGINATMEWVDWFNTGVTASSTRFRPRNTRPLTDMKIR